MKSIQKKSDENPPMYASLYPAYANIWITEGLWASVAPPTTKGRLDYGFGMDGFSRRACV